MVRGIANQSGVACHLSCALQILFHCAVPLREALIELSQTSRTRRKSVLTRLGDFFALLSEDDTSPIDPTSLYQYLEKETTLDPNNLGDAVKALRILIQTIRQQCAIEQQQRQVDVEESSSCDTLKQLVDVSLTGRVRYDLCGRNGSKTRTKSSRERDMVHPLPVPGTKGSVLKGLGAVTTPMRVQGYRWDADQEEQDDDGDNGQWETTKALRLLRFPQHLFLHLERFEHCNGKLSLLQQDNPLGIPMELQDWNDTHHQDNKHSSPPRRRCLCGAMVHVEDKDEGEEESEGGHYVVLVRCDNKKDNWVLLDDDRVQPLVHDDERVIDFLSGRQSLPELPNTTCAATLVVYNISSSNGDGDNVVENSTKHEDDRLDSLVLRLREQLLEESNVQMQKNEALIGRRLRVRWARGKYYAGVVSAFDDETGYHTVRYDDGDVRDYLLQQKTIEWIDDDDDATPSSPPPFPSSAEGSQLVK